MNKNLLLLLIVLSIIHAAGFAQPPKTGAGIGIYPTGTETGFGYRSSKEKRWAVDIRIAKANFFTRPSAGSLINEASFVYRMAHYEKVRFHAGLGGRADWSFTKTQSHRFGFVTPFGVEAFPFPFQHAGLFFEAAPFCAWDNNRNANIGIRTVAGFVFYFLKKEKHE